MSAPYTGGCLCGAIRYEFTSEPATVYTCHCTECQKVSASAFGMSVRIKAEDFKITRGAPKSTDTVADSGRVKTGLFCGDCGSRICNQPSGGGPVVIIKTGTLDDPLQFQPVAHIWTRSAQPWFPFNDGLAKFEKMPEDAGELPRLWDARAG